jgi:uncharacterized protein YjbJ (UPF0337 family)
MVGNALDGSPPSTRRGRDEKRQCASGDRDMNADVLKGQWKQLKGDIKMRWNKLTDDDVDVIDGAREKLEGRLQERYGWAKDKAAAEVDSWTRDRSAAL